ncbi:MAG: ABC-F type ribosomal protection protein [Defluviitaleaceae bacterium]|nr:ABC-F type ribosomal protection protein [Defluviitaleaceae bacterium]
MSQISVQNLTFAYEGSYDNIFEDVSFQMDTSWKLGFTGRNGRGKTTFLNLLQGKYEYQGKISASVKFDYFPFDVADKTAATQAVVDEICQDYQEWELARELSLLEVDESVLTRPFNTLSGGEQTKVMLASLFLNENNFLLIDEPTNHLDIHGRQTVADYLNSKQGFILVSHDRAFLDGCVSHILSINKADITVTRGNFSRWWENKTRQDNFEMAENSRLKKDIKRLEATASQKRKWSDDLDATKAGFGNERHVIGERVRKLNKRVKNMERRQERAIEEKSGLLKNIEQADDLKIFPLKYHTSQLISLRDVGIKYGDKTVCKGVSFIIERGDRIALQGKNGSGKSSIFKLICGTSAPHTGDVNIGSQLKISYVSQDTSHLSGNLTDYADKNNLDESLFKAVLRQLDFSRTQFDKNMEDFSGGQKKKVLLARSLCQPAHLLVWDEPLNFIDIYSRMQIEGLLLKYQPTILFVEHDAVFVDMVANKTVTLP